MERKHLKWILIVGFVLVLFVVGIFLLRKPDPRLTRSVDQDPCDWFLGTGKEPNLWETMFAMQMYFHCSLNIFKKEDQDCYQEIHDHITKCLESRHQTLPEYEIQRGITGGIMTEFCADINKACAEVRKKEEQSDPPKSENDVKALEITEMHCRESLNNACQDLNSK